MTDWSEEVKTCIQCNIIMKIYSLPRSCTFELNPLFNIFYKSKCPVSLIIFGSERVNIDSTCTNIKDRKRLNCNVGKLSYLTAALCTLPADTDMAVVNSPYPDIG